MKKTIFFLLLGFALFSCKNKSGAPDVSGISVHIPVERFDQHLFSIDTNDIASGLRKLQEQHPDFYLDFMQNILGVSGSDTSGTTLEITREFLRGYAPVQQYLAASFKNTDRLQQELEQAYRYVKYYFPHYKTGKAVLFTGPFDAPGVASVNAGIAIGLQQYAGNDYPEYQAPVFQEMFPSYISRRFSREYIVANCMKAVTEELFPDRSAGKPLIEQMIEKGKQWYVLDRFLPGSPDSIKTGFTQKQLDWCSENEGLIWAYIIRNEDLNSLSPAVLQTYIGEAPFTQGFSQEQSPGNLGQWIGWQIVKKFAAKNAGISIQDLMQTAAATINEQAKYKPK
ncbi:MAG: hypothetical protein HYZ15_00770 [Sphingobacteriales bacterium]|nr:hypothetical protein [Sphingobacteriales bacterium]